MRKLEGMHGPENSAPHVARPIKTEPKRHAKIAEIAMKNERRTAILRIIKDKGEVTIKDISNAIKNVSEKTIQRELISLVSERTLKREGDKRGSRYMIAG